MSFGRRSNRPRTSKGGPPTLFVFLVGIAIVFGMYYLWLGVQNYLRTGGLGVTEATERADILSTATAAQARPTDAATLRPSVTPVPPCEDFYVSVPNAIVRESPNATAPIVTSLFENTPVCVVGRPNPDSEWYTIDMTPGTRRLDVAYMHESVITSRMPTPTVTLTVTSLPTITPQPSNTAAPSPTITPTPDTTTETALPQTLLPESLPDTPIPPTSTPETTPTQVRQSA